MSAWHNRFVVSNFCVSVPFSAILIGEVDMAFQTMLILSPDISAYVEKKQTPYSDLTTLGLRSLDSA